MKHGRQITFFLFLIILLIWVLGLSSCSSPQKIKSPNPNAYRYRDKSKNSRVSQRNSSNGTIAFWFSYALTLHFLPKSK